MQNWVAGEIFFCAINFKNAHILTYNYTFTIYICTCKLITILCLERYYSTGFASFFYSNISLLWFCLFVDFMVHSLGHIYVLQSVFIWLLSTFICLFCFIIPHLFAWHLMFLIVCSEGILMALRMYVCIFEWLKK